MYSKMVFFKGFAKGIQFKTVVEYAPSQRVPQQWSKKDGREGTIFEDPEYGEFLYFLAKPAENLPSAEIQLERREAELVSAGKETLIVTPLMDFIHQKRASKSGSRKSSSNSRPSKRAVVSSAGGISAILKRGSERRNSSKKVLELLQKVCIEGC